MTDLSVASREGGWSREEGLTLVVLRPVDGTFAGWRHLKLLQESAGVGEVGAHLVVADHDGVVDQQCSLPLDTFGFLQGASLVIAKTDKRARPHGEYKVVSRSKLLIFISSQPVIQTCLLHDFWRQREGGRQANPWLHPALATTIAMRVSYNWFHTELHTVMSRA